MNTKSIPLSASSHQSRLRFVNKFKDQILLQLMVLPGIIFLIIFAYLPMAGLIIAFQDFRIIKGFAGSPWVGLKQFELMFTDPVFWLAVKNTVLLSLVNLGVGFFAPVILALSLNEIPFARFKKIVQTSSYLPYFISWAVVASMWLTLLEPNGLINSILIQLGLIQKPIGFWTQQDLFRPMAATVTIWKGAGWAAIIYLAAISQVDQELYEAAMLDGAGRFARIFHITLPALKPLIAILFILNLGTLVRGNLDVSVLFGNPFNYQSSYIIEAYTLDLGFKLTRDSFATAVGLVQSSFSLLLVIAANWAAAKFADTRLF
jgi:putative aldouronate transport system permease protein